MKARYAILLVSLLVLAGPTSASGASPFQPLVGRAFQGRSIVGAHGTHPVRHPADLQVSFRTAQPSGFGNVIPTLYWRSGCSGHEYLLFSAHHRLRAGEPLSTEEPCIGQRHREEHWLVKFFAVDLDWSLRHGRLTLSSGPRRIVLVGKWLLRPSS